MKASLAANPVSDKDRLALTLFLAAAIHGILILGLSFKALTNHFEHPPSTLNVLLVQTATRKAPKEASFLAQANQLASGNNHLKGHPGSPFFSQTPSPFNGVAPTPHLAASPRAAEENHGSHTLSSSQSEYDLPAYTPARHHPYPGHHENQNLLQLQLEQARLADEIRRETRNYNQRPRRLFLDTVNAKTAVEADYLAHWVQRVERIGNLNYPNYAIQHHIQGQLILNVLISRTGRLLRSRIAVSSGSQSLDDAAKRIVRLASPFPPFPRNMRKHYDQILITRTWVFKSGHLHTSPSK